MDSEELKNWYEDKYEKLLGLNFQEWINSVPESEDAAYIKLQQLDIELQNTEEKYQQSEGDEKWELGEYRERLRNEYQMLEEMFGLESQDE